METIFVIVVIVLLIIYLLAQNSKKESKIERYGEAVSSAAQMAADGVSNLARDITESPSNKKIRIAKEELSLRNCLLYHNKQYWQKDYVDRLLTVDEKFAYHLSVLGLSEDKWKEIAYNIFCISVIRRESREIDDLSKKNSQKWREHIFHDKKYLSYSTNVEALGVLKTALAHFGIPEDEWITYGDTVIEMHDVVENMDDGEYSLICPIKPMNDNEHLL